MEEYGGRVAVEASLLGSTSFLAAVDGASTADEHANVA